MAVTIGEMPAFSRETGIKTSRLPCRCRFVAIYTCSRDVFGCLAALSSAILKMSPVGKAWINFLMYVALRPVGLKLFSSARNKHVKRAHEREPGDCTCGICEVCFHDMVAPLFVINGFASWDNMGSNWGHSCARFVNRGVII